MSPSLANIDSSVIQASTVLSVTISPESYYVHSCITRATHVQKFTLTIIGLSYFSTSRCFRNVHAMSYITCICMVFVRKLLNQLVDHQYRIEEEFNSGQNAQRLVDHNHLSSCLRLKNRAGNSISGPKNSSFIKCLEPCRTCSQLGNHCTPKIRCSSML